METKNVRMDWPKIGREFSDKNQTEIIAFLESLDSGELAHAQHDEWIDVSTKPRLPLSQGMAITEAIKEFRIPRVSHVAYTARFAPGSALAIQGHYGKGGVQRVDIVLLDDGCSVTPLAMRVWG